MAKRFGKYKISNRESEISLRDGGTIAGNADIAGSLTMTGGGVLTGNQGQVISVSNTARVLTVAESGATVVVSGGVCTLTLPLVTTSAGVKFTLVAGSAHAHVISSSEATAAGKIQGTIMDGANTANNAAGAGSQLLANEQVLTLANPAIGDTLDCISDGTNWYFKGAVNDTVTSAA